MKTTDLIDQASLRTDIPDFAPGDTLKVHVKVIEGNKERVQVFQGAVIARQGGGLQETFTVRKLSYGVGVERTFPLHSPIIDRIELHSRGDVRRAKLYYLRDRVGKAAKIKEKRDYFVLRRCLTGRRPARALRLPERAPPARGPLALRSPQQQARTPPRRWMRSSTSSAVGTPTRRRPTTTGGPCCGCSS